MNKREGYISYLLRIWETANGETRLWRAQLEQPGTGERRGFASLQDLFRFLESQTRLSANPHPGDEKDAVTPPSTES